MTSIRTSHFVVLDPSIWWNQRTPLFHWQMSPIALKLHLCLPSCYSICLFLGNLFKQILRKKLQKDIFIAWNWHLRSNHFSKWFDSHIAWNRCPNSIIFRYTTCAPGTLSHSCITSSTAFSTASHTAFSMEHLETDGVLIGILLLYHMSEIKVTLT
jgi:hypothetical protein